MPRWKTTQNILNLKSDGEYFDENWMNYDSIYQYMPPSPTWVGDRPIKFEDVDLWEVIVEHSGPVGVYAAWCPYAPYFIVTKRWRLVAEFWGMDGEKQLQEYMKNNNISFSINKVWVDDSYIDNYVNPSGTKPLIL